MNTEFRIASGDAEFEDGKSLFRKYAEHIGIDLSFQNFSNELTTVDVQYNKPKGALLLAYANKRAVGCVAIRDLGNGIAELKRMFVLPEFQGLGIGRKMMVTIIDVAKELDYKTMRLDTLAGMSGALKLYRDFGFYEIPAYRLNPFDDAVYLEKQL